MMWRITRSVDHMGGLFVLAVCSCMAVVAVDAKELPVGAAMDLVGQDLAGWVVEGKGTYELDGKTLPVWTVENGVIHCAGKGFGFLRYDRSVGDFELHIEYRFTPGCNSGIGLRTVPYTGQRKTRPSQAGIEIQILDEKARPDATYKKPSRSMAIYGHVDRPEDFQEPAGHWNAVDIRYRGPRLGVVLNGHRVHDLDQRDVKTLKDKPLEGYFSLQNHGHAIEFRNIRMKCLQRSEESSGGESE